MLIINYNKNAAEAEKQWNKKATEFPNTGARQMMGRLRPMRRDPSGSAGDVGLPTRTKVKAGKRIPLHHGCLGILIIVYCSESHRNNW